MNSFYTEEELTTIGFESYGTDVKISRKASIYGAQRMVLGNHVRVDDFCILSGHIEIGNNIHIAAYSALYGAEVGIVLCDFSNISSRVCIYAVSDDYSGHTMTNPTVPDKYKNVQQEAVSIGKHVIIGSSSTVLPGVVMAEGTALGAMSLLKKDTQEWSIYAGIPAKKISSRSKELLNLEKEYLNEHN